MTRFALHLTAVMQAALFNYYRAEVTDTRNDANCIGAGIQNV